MKTYSLYSITFQTRISIKADKIEISDHGNLVFKSIEPSNPDVSIMSSIKHAIVAAYPPGTWTDLRAQNEI